MAKIHEIGIGADTRAFEDNIRRGVIRPAEEAERALDELGDTDAGRDVARDLEQAGDALKQDVIEPAEDAERALKELGDTDAGREAARDLDKLEEKLKDAQRESEKLEKSVDDVGDGGHKSFGKVGEAAQEVTQEVGQNLGEAVSSVRGNLADLGQVGQDTLGGLAATLAGTGPAGIAGAAALAAGAVGLGLVTAEVEKQQERVQQLKEYFAEAWQEAVAGGKDYIDQATVIGEMQDIIFNPDRAEEYKRIQEDANTLALDQSTLLRAAAGDQDALNLVIQRSGDLYDDQKKKINDVGVVTTAGAQLTAESLRDEATKLQGINERWREYGDINAENQQKAKDAAATTSAYLLSAVDDADTATKAVDDFGNVLVTLPDGREIVIDAKTGQATEDVTRFKKDTDEVVEHLDGSEIRLLVKTALQQAENEVNRFIKRQNGKSFTVHGRFRVDSGDGRYLP